MSETYEKYAAIRQGAQNHSSEEYFKARPQIDSGDRRRVFEAGFERAYDLRETEITALRSQVAELQRQLDGYDQAAKQEPVVEVRDNPDDYGFVYEWISESVLPWPGLKLYAAPANLPALIEQARKEERESALKIMRHAAAALAHAAESNPMYQDAYNEIDAAIRARKP